MSPVALAWIVSLGGALAFTIAGYLIGRNRLPVALGAAPRQHAPNLEPARAAVTPRAEAAPPVPPELVTSPSATSSATSSANVPAPRTARPKTVDASYLEGRLTRSLRELDPERALMQLVLCDDAGLPLAAADPTPGGETGAMDDPEALSALGAEALTLMGRVGDVLSASRAVTVELAGGRRLQVRPITTTEVPIFLVSIGRETVSEQRFRAFSDEIATLIASTSDAPRA